MTEKSEDYIRGFMDACKYIQSCIPVHDSKTLTCLVDLCQQVFNSAEERLDLGVHRWVEQGGFDHSRHMDNLREAVKEELGEKPEASQPTDAGKQLAD